MAKLEEIAHSTISMAFIVVNTETLLRLLRFIAVFIFMLISGLQKAIESLSLAHEREYGYDFLEGKPVV